MPYVSISREVSIGAEVIKLRRTLGGKKARPFSVPVI